MNNVLGMGADKNATFSVMSGKGLFVSGKFGELWGLEERNRYESEIRKYLMESGVKPDVVVCDIHPDYISSRVGETLSGEFPGSKVKRVQHHYAHLASCIFENGIEGGAIGMVFDGNGYGIDGNIWGGEVILSEGGRFERAYHLEYVHQPGGDIAAKEAWRMGLSYLYSAYGGHLHDMDLDILRRIGRDKAAMITDVMRKKINSPLTSSMGRLFDAVSSLIGVCDVSQFEAEAAISLEKISAKDIKDCYNYDITGDEIIVRTMIKEIIGDMRHGYDKSVIAAKFHNTLVRIVEDVAERLNAVTGLTAIALSGGCFQNRFLVDRLNSAFRGSKFRVYTQNIYSTTDSGLSVGQAVIAAGCLVK